MVAVGHNILQQNNCVCFIRNKTWIYSKLLHTFQLVVISRYSLIFHAIIIIIVIIIIIIVIIVTIIITIIIIIAVVNNNKTNTT